MNPGPSKVILDTNLLLLWLVARTDATLLHQFKRVQAFTYQDIELLREILQPYREFVTTPHILSETSNFIDQAPPWQRAALVEQLKDFIRSGVEVYRSAATLIERDEFNALGLTQVRHQIGIQVILTYPRSTSSFCSTVVFENAM